MFCDRLDDALKPMRALAMARNTANNRSTSFTARFRRNSIQSKTLKNLQRVCDKVATQHAAFIREFILYCPWRSNTFSVNDWHIQVIPRTPVSASSSSSFDTCIFDTDTVPSTVSVPNTPTSTQQQTHGTRTPPTFHPLPFDVSSSTTGTSAQLQLQPRPRPRLSFSRRHSHSQNNNTPRMQRQTSMGSSSSIATSDEDSGTNPFMDDPNDSLAMSRDGLMELDRQMDVDGWSQVPTMTPGMSLDQMPIPMPPPAPYQKVVE
jgi:hypothetical protein